MANIASVAYAIEGPKEILQKINEAIVVAIHTDDDRYELYKAAEYLKLPIEEGVTRLRGDITEEPRWESSGALRFFSEEKWDLQDFAILLENHFYDIKVWYTVEESGMTLFYTNDVEGKFFPERYFVDTCIDDIYNSEYFQTEEAAYQWLDNLTYGRVKSKEDVDKFNTDHEDSGSENENFIYIYEFEIV